MIYDKVTVSVVEKGRQQMRRGYCEGLKRDQTVKICRLTDSENFVCKKEQHAFNAFFSL